MLIQHCIGKFFLVYILYGKYSDGLGNYRQSTQGVVAVMASCCQSDHLIDHPHPNHTNHPMTIQ